MNTFRLVIASANTGKIKEIEALFQPFGFQCISSLSLGLPEPEETGQTFAENAALKAQAAAEQTGSLAIADDSGFCVEALNGAPGLFSARWAGVDKNFSRAMTRVWEAFCKTGVKNRQASFVCALALASPIPGAMETKKPVDKQEPIERKPEIAEENQKVGISPLTLKTLSQNKLPVKFKNLLTFQGVIEGQLSWPPRGQMGFGYDPIFIPKGYQQSFAEMPRDTKEAISHRTRAFEALKLSGVLDSLHLHA